MASKSKLSVVVDLGTSKIVALAGAKTEAGKIEVSGIAKTTSKGIKRGLIFNIEEVAHEVSEVLNALKTQIEEKIELVNVAFAGQHIKTIDFACSKFTSDENIVSEFDIEHLYNEAQKAEITDGFKILQVIPILFTIDDECIELNPVGSIGRKVEANYKLLVVPEIYLLNLQRVFDKVGVKLGEVTLSTLAISEAVLSEDEKEMGVIVLDMGAGTTNMAIYHESKLIHTAVIPFGGEVVTQDIKEGCSILYKWAEQLKIQYGQALGDFADDQKVVTIPGQNGWEPKEISFKSLAFIIQARIEEIMDSVNHQIAKSEVDDQLGAGIVVAGGTSNLENFIALVKFQTGMDARKANTIIDLNIKNKEIQNPENATALGLLSLIVNESETSSKGRVEIKTPKKERKRITPWISNFVQGVLDIVDDDNEDIALN